METMSRRSVLVTAILALCLAMSISLYSNYKHKQAIQEGDYSAQSIDRRSMPPHLKRPGGSKNQDSYKKKRGGWGPALLPFCTIGVFLYVIYIVGKILQRKFTHTAKRHEPYKLDRQKQSKAKRKSKAKLTMDEVRQLEQQLLETETAIQQIFEQTNQAVAATSKIFDENQTSGDEAPAALRCTATQLISSSDTDEDMISRNSKMLRGGITRPKRRRKWVTRKQQSHSENNTEDANSSSAEERHNTNSSGTYEESSDNFSEPNGEYHASATNQPEPQGLADSQIEKTYAPET